jgi:hypothetical protein
VWQIKSALSKPPRLKRLPVTAYDASSSVVPSGVRSRLRQLIDCDSPLYEFSVTQAALLKNSLQPAQAKQAALPHFGWCHLKPRVIERI